MSKRKAPHNWAWSKDGRLFIREEHVGFCQVLNMAEEYIMLRDVLGMLLAFFRGESAPGFLSPLTEKVITCEGGALGVARAVQDALAHKLEVIEDDHPLYHQTRYDVEETPRRRGGPRHFAVDTPGGMIITFPNGPVHDDDCLTHLTIRRRIEE